MSTREKDPAAECLRIILNGCIGSDPEAIREIACDLKDNDAISKNQRKKICKDAKDGLLKAAIDKIVDSLLQHNEHLWKSATLLALSDQDFTAELNMLKLLNHVLEEKELSHDVLYLLQSWNDLLASWKEILPVLKSTWPSEEVDIPTPSWICQFIFKCSTEYLTLDVEKFVTGMKSIIGEKRPAESSQKAKKNKARHEVETVEEHLQKTDSTANYMEVDQSNASSQGSSNDEAPSKKLKLDKGPTAMASSDLPDVVSPPVTSNSDTDNTSQPKKMEESLPTSGITAELQEMKLSKNAPTVDAMDVNENKTRRVVDVKGGKNSEGKVSRKDSDPHGKKEEKSRQIPKIRSHEELQSLRSDDSSEDVEFRVILGKGQSLQPNYRLYICTDSFLNWGAMEMHIHQSKRYFFCILPIPKHIKSILYKYCIRSDDNTVWEAFVHCGSSLSNRVIHDREKTPAPLHYDIVSFIYDYYSQSWYSICQDSMKFHLPYPKDVVLYCEDEEQAPTFSIGREIFCWVHKVKSGWKLTSSYNYRPLPANDVVERSLLGWLERNAKACENGNTHDIIKRIIAALALAMALHHHDSTIFDRELLRAIFRALSVHELDDDGQKLLYDEIMAECRSHNQGSIPNILDTIIFLFKQVADNPMADWLLALPLYWLVHDEGAICKGVIKVKNQQGLLLFQRSNLPTGNGLKWSEVRRRCHLDNYQKEFVDLSHILNEIRQVHPWIAGTFQYFLNQRLVIDIVQDRHKYKIAEGFLVDSLFRQLLHACLSGRYASGIDISDVMKLSEHFVCKLQAMTEAANAEMSDPDAMDKSLEAPNNILTTINTLLADIAKNTSTYKQRDKENNEVLWCLNMASMAAVLAKAIVKTEETKLKEANDCLEKILSSVTTRIHKGDINDDQLQLWNRLMTMGWHDGKFSQRWKKLIRDEIKQKIENRWHHKDEDFLDYYALTLDKIELCESVEACFSEKAFKCTEDLLGKHDIGKGEHSWSSKFRGVMSRFKTPRFVRIFDNLFVKELRKAKMALAGNVSFDMEALMFLFNWPFAPRFFRLFYTEETLSKFSSETREKIREVYESFQCSVASLKTGGIVVKLLKLILSRERKFFELCDTLKPMNETSVDKQSTYLTHVLEQCKKQLAAFDTAKQDVHGFLQACAKLDEGSEVHVNSTELKNKLKVNFEEQLLSHISPDSSTGRTSQPSFFGLPQKILKQFEIINFIKDSKVFHEMWSQTALYAKNECEDAGFDLGDGGLWHVRWRDAVSDIWQATKRDLTDLVQEIDSGALTLGNASEWFQRCKGERGEIKNEIETLYEYYKIVTKKDEPGDAKMEAAKAKTAPKVVKDVKMQEARHHTDDSSSSDEDDDSMKSDVSSRATSESEPDDMEEEEEEIGSDEDGSTQSEGSEIDPQDCTPLINLGLRTRQLSNYFQLEKAKETIDLLLDIKDKLHLTGDFSSIEIQRARAENKNDMSLVDLPDDQAIPSVCNIPQENVEALQLFMNEQELISWLKEKMNDISEVKVMCDLAMISAGETPYEVDIVSCLLSAVMGFAPLIFELEDSAGLTILLQKCDQVWKNLEADPKLQEKWKDTGRQLRWFQGIENFHGSVEKQSLTLAQEINEHGIYRIGRCRDGETLTAANCIDLVLPLKAGDGQPQVLRLSALCDLQSKLMLIAGEAEKGQKDVAQFVEVLTSVQILAETFVKLVSAGCMLFSNWSAMITCDHISTSENSENLLIQIKFADDAQPLGGQGSIKNLTELSVILNQALDRWNNYVSTKRLEHYFLNEYNIQQVIYLCQQLAVGHQRNKLPDQVCALLSNVVKNPRQEDIQISLEEATRVRDEDHQQEKENDKMETEESNEPQEISKIELKKRAVRTLVSRDELSEELAKAAVQAESHAEMDDCLNWALLNQFDEELIAQLCEKFDEEAGFQHNEREVQVLTSVLHNRSQNTLKDVIDRLQEKLHGERGGSASLVDSINTICAGYLDETMIITLKDSLSLEHFGRFLDILWEKSERMTICRELMPPLHVGKPNLLICLEQEILNTALSLYMHNPDAPLPTTMEVLVCSNLTPADEVERFMRRAMLRGNHGSRLLFVLAFADRLGFNVATATEKTFNVLSQDARTDDQYQLVILLSKQQHYLTTCFDKYLVEGKWIKTNLEISSYLQKHLKVRAAVRNSAACVDKNHSTVKIVSSTRSGVGKSLHVKRLSEQLGTMIRPMLDQWEVLTIRLLESTLNLDYVIERLAKVSSYEKMMIVHLDLTPAVQRGIETFAFNLLVLGCIQDSHGKVWKRRPGHLYMVEMTDCGFQGKTRFSNRHILNLLPAVKCYAPREVLTRGVDGGEWLGMDMNEFRSATFQRPFQYLKLFDEGKNLDSFVYQKPEGTPAECIEVLLRHCCMNNPSWAQLRHFASFLNVQLQNCENSVFCDPSIAGQELPGLKQFAVKFMIRMSQDFATPSLKISDESTMDHGGERDGEAGLGQYQFRRRWEESSHPYLFFNEDRATMSFINVNISDTGDLLDKNGEVKEARIITQQLVNGLKLQRVSLDLNFDTFTREQKLGILCQVMGIQDVFDPDPTYELTTDNILKILAIYMRFRCRIPVIIMGETGCGKTRMVEFMSRLKAGMRKGGAAAGVGKVKNMITLKIHGGITVKDIHKSVRKAQEIARDNRDKLNLSTILFYDEANTTEAIYAIKEVMCDLTIDGTSFHDSQLQIVAACNPYKKLSKEAIQKLEDSGLGYRIRTSDTTHLFGNIPMRTLVYRVVALPPSMQPFVWDFGQLGDEAESIYIQQMTKKLAQRLALDRDTVSLVNAVLSEAQKYMRSRKDECRYVSLRDVERCVVTFEWFHRHRRDIYPLIEKELEHRYSRMTRETPDLTDGARSLIQTIGVCYHASLDNRRPFREQIAYIFGLETTHVTEIGIREELAAAQTVFLRNMKMDDNVARNEALQENVFMMTVCADMRIPLFLIGKPGSSKSLAKTIVADNMQGGTSRSSLYKKLKQVHILSYQCSALTDAAGIESVFKQCAQLQVQQDLDAYSAVVVLDEIGLAEDSPNMPLKVLHPLLESGSTEGGSLTDYDPRRKVGFIGISNWALDPAKMNRGIFVTRNKPNKDDLKKTAKGIFENHKNKINQNLELLEKLTETYMDIYDKQDVEYFGLRDYYSLIKMIHNLVTSSRDAEVTFLDVANAILRNFSGGKTPHFATFQRNLRTVFNDTLMTSVPIRQMIEHNLRERESRFLLLLTNEFSAAGLLHLCIDNFENRVQVVFGSSFPGDHNYTDICRNINRIKVCMETGRTVVLLNMTEIHESLYDALNQHYVTFGGQRYVDLGLGGHRVKCRIADNFRLIVVEQKEVVYREYPIPLINRLEKHHLDSKGLLSPKQKAAERDLSDWASKCAEIRSRAFRSRDAFIGWHDDTVSSVILMTGGEEIEECRQVMLQSCAMDAVFRLPESQLGGEVEAVQEIYLRQQFHDSLLLLLKEAMKAENKQIPLLEVASYSNVLSEKDREEIEAELGQAKNSVMLLSLEQFQTEHEYSNKLEEFFRRCRREDVENTAAILLIQCSQAQSHGQLIACAKYCLMNKIKEFREAERNQERKVIVSFLLSTERENRSESDKNSLILQHTPDNRIVYTDELRPTNKDIAPASHFYKTTLCQVLEMGRDELEHGRQEGSLVNIMSLLRDCVCESVAKVKSRLSKSERYFERVKMLSRLCSDDDVASLNFRKILLQKMVDLYREKEEQAAGVMNNDWIVNEACNRESLQEGGTFRKTLWLCLKRHVSRLMAYAISISDRGDNLDLLTAEGSVPWKVDMWLAMFEALPLSWSAIRNTQEFTIATPRHHTTTVLCQIPFSFEINDFFNTQWEILAKRNAQNMREIFFSLFRKSPMYRVVASAARLAKVANFMKAYTSDMVSALYVPGSTRAEEQEAVEKIIIQLSMKKYGVLRREKSFSDGDEIALVFFTFKEVQRYLNLMSELFKACPQVLNHTEEWLKKQNEQDEFLIHVFVLKSLLELLQERAAEINVPASCLEWKKLVTTLKHIYNSLYDQVNNENERKELLKMWIPLSLLDLLILQLLPSTSAEDQFEHYLAVIAPHAKLLWRGSMRAEVKSEQFLRIISNVLRKCYEDLRLKLLISWEDSTCRLCKKKVQNPTFLPCGHFTCEPCIGRLLAAAQAGRKCPTCAATVPDNVALPAASLDAAKENELADFKSNCTSFFLEYLKQFCFATHEGSQVSMEVQMKLILKDLIVQIPNERKELESSALDLNINTKSCILRVLLTHGLELVKAELNDSLGKIDRDQMRSLVTTILKCLEQKLMLDTSVLEENRIVYIDRWEKILGSAWRKLLMMDEELTTKMDMLQTVAEMRCSLKVAAECINDVFKAKDLSYDVCTKADSFIRFVINICTDDESENILKEFITKVACHVYGADWFHNMADNPNMNALVPPVLSEAAEDSKMDCWSLLGPTYLRSKGNLYKSSEKNVPKVVAELLGQNQDQPVDRLGKILAVIAWALNKDKDAKKVVNEALRQSPDSQTIFFKFLSEMDKNILPAMKAVDRISDLQVYQLQQLLTLVAATATCQNYMMAGFYHMMARPSVLVNMFLPGMPEDAYFSTPADYRRQGYNMFYRCPNGHLYTIGECRQPMQTAKCADCGATIGGTGHRPAQGNQMQQIMDEKTQAGYLLNKKQQGAGDAADRISKQGAAVVQFLLHSCMLIGLCNEPNGVFLLLGCRDNQTAQQYLIKQLLKHLQELSESLARNADDAVLVMHRILHSLLNQRAGPVTPDWTNLENRRTWETAFRERFLLPIFRNLDNEIMAAQNAINEGEDQCSLALHRLVHDMREDPRQSTRGAVDLMWGDLMLWIVIDHSSSAHLLQFLGDSATANNGVLQIILKSPDLHQVKFLENVLQLQNALIQKYQNEIDIAESENIKLRDFLREGGHSYEKHVLDYIATWNAVYKTLQSKLVHEKRLTEFFEPMSMRSPISTAMPSTRGRGQCAKLLAEHLIDIQNKFLTDCKLVLTSTESINEVEVSQLSHSHFVRLDKQKDLLPLIHLHTKYNIVVDRQGRRHLITYNVDALEKQAREKFVMYKKQIAKQSLPCMQYPQDIGIGTDWDSVLTNIPQLPLTAKIAQDVDRIVARVHSADVCEGVRTLAHAISFLAKVKNNGKSYLYEFLEKDLLLSASRTSVVPKSAQIEHTLSLYQRLSWHKAVSFAGRGLNPYKEALSMVEQNEITDREVLTELKEVFEHSDVMLLQQRLNELLIKVPDFNADWSLTDIFPYFEFIDNKGDDDSWYARLPDEICFKHVSHLFTLAVQFTAQQV